MELVRTHDAMDLVPPAIRVELGDGRPEAGDLQHHLGTVAEQEFVVLGRLIVPPDVVENGRIDVSLVVAEVPIPASRAWVEVDDLGLLLAVATALPGIHRPPVTDLFRRRAGLVEAPVAIHQELARYLGQPEVEERVIAKLVPGSGVMVEGIGERFVAADGLYGIGQRLIYGVVARVEQGDHLLDAHRAILFDIKGQCLLDVVVRLVEVTTYTHYLVLPVNSGSRCLGDVYM